MPIKLYIALLLLMLINACGDSIPFENQYCALLNDDVSPACSSTRFKKEDNVPCSDTAINYQLNPNAGWVVVDNREIFPCDTPN